MLHKLYRPRYCQEFPKCEKKKNPCDEFNFTNSDDNDNDSVLCERKGPCGDLNFDECTDTCYSAGNNFAYDLNANPRINICDNLCPGCGCQYNPRCIVCKVTRSRRTGPCIPNQICNPLRPFTGSNSNNCCRVCEMNPLYRFFIIDLISNLLNRARIQDICLINPWGMLFIDEVLWVANNGTGLITDYDQRGTKLDFSVTVRDVPGRVGRPTGLVENMTTGFIIPTTLTTANPRPSFLLVASENGTVSAFNPLFDQNNTIICINRSNIGAVYTGLTISNNNLYVCDFHNSRIDVFNRDFTLLSGFDFIDSDAVNPMPSGYAPFNIVLINDLLYVTYALLEAPANVRNRPGQGNGYVSVFTFGGMFVRRLISRGFLNSPWGIVLAPEAVGFPARSIFVGNNGDGIINIYDGNGLFLGRLTDYNGFFVQLPGLWSLISNNSRSIYFSSGPNDRTDGLIGLLANRF